MSAADWAARYVERFSLALVPLHGKAPYCDGWQRDENLIRDPAAARAHWTAHPTDGIGACLEPSGLVSLDCDDLDAARTVLGAEGIDLDKLIETTPTILGRAPRLEFRAPQVPLARKSVVWPARSDGAKPVTVLEFRAGRVQDVLPPSMHPDTGRPYRWLTPPSKGFPPLPAQLLAIWQDADSFKRRARNLCPWAAPEPEPEFISVRSKFPRSRLGPSVIRQFNEAYDPVSILEAHGYQRTGRNRFRSPRGHGMAGVVLLPTGKIFCHHTSDGLGDGRAHDAFDIFAALKHRGDVRAAVRAAAELLGMNERRSIG